MRWIKLYESITEWEWHDKPEMMSLFIHLLVYANSMPNKWHGIEIPRGSLITSYRKLSEKTGIAQTTLVRCIKKMVDSEVIATEKVKAEREFTLISILKYDTYQAKKEDSGTQTELERNSKGTQTELLLEYKNNRIEEIKNKDFLKKTHTEIFQKFLELCKNDTKRAERLTSEFVKYNANKPDTWWNGGLWKNHIQGYYRKDLKLNVQQTQSPQIASAPPKVQASAKAPPQPQPEAVAAWKKVLEDLKGEIKLSDYKTWFQPIKPLKLENQTLTINVPTNFFREYLEEYFVKELKTALNKHEICNLNYEIIV